MNSDSELLSTIRRGFYTSKCRIDRKCSCGNILIFPYMNEQREWVGHNYKLWNVPGDGWTRGVTRGCCVTSTFPRRVSRCEIRENIENDTIKVSPLPAESTRLLYGGGRGMDRATGVERNDGIANLQEVRFGLSMWIIHTITTGRIALVFFRPSFSNRSKSRDTYCYDSGWIALFSNFFLAQSRLYLGSERLASSKLITFPVFLGSFRFCRCSTT